MIHSDATPPMKALTLHQPWASLIALGVKHIETRHWSTSYRGPLAIHAGARKPTRAERFVGELLTRGIGSYAGGAWILEGPGLPPYRTSPRLEGYQLPLGAVVATCELMDVVPTDELRLRSDAEQRRNPDVPWEQHPWPDRLTTFVHENQLPYGDFTPGRFAWLLSDIKPVDPPVPCKGRQGLWNWTP